MLNRFKRIRSYVIHHSFRYTFFCTARAIKYSLWVVNILFVCSTYSLFSQDTQINPVETITIAASESTLQPTKMFIGMLGDRNNEFCQKIVADFKHCCKWSGRFEPTVTWLQNVPKKRSSVQKLFDQEYDCAVFITCDNIHNGVVEWRLYDTIEGQMLQGKKIVTESPEKIAYILATHVLQELTHEQQPFLSKLVYRKREKKGRLGIGACSLVVTDFDGSNAQVVMCSPQRILVAPRWTHDTKHPAIVFSEFTPNNVRLKMCDLQGKSAVILDHEGTTVGIAFADDTKKVVYCRSGDIWEYHYDYQNNKGVHSRLIHQEVCSHPNLLQNGDVIYACHGSIKKYDAKSKISHTVPIQGYCVAPCYAASTERIVYAKRINGHMQLFVYDLNMQKDEQLTFSSLKIDDVDDHSDKTDPFWAPDGIHVVFCWERDGSNRIAMLNTLNKQYHFITSEQEHCSYPAWSGNLM